MVDSIALLWNVDFGYFFGFDTVLNESKIDDRVTEEVGLFVITFLDGINQILMMIHIYQLQPLLD